MPTVAAIAPARASVPMAKRLTPGVLEEGWVGDRAPRSDVGIGGMELSRAFGLEPALPCTAAGAPCDVCPWTEPARTSPGFAVACPATTGPAPYGIMGYPVWAVATMLRLVCGGISRAVALSYT